MQQRRAGCSYPCGSALAASVGRMDTALLLSCRRPGSRRPRSVALAAGRWHSGRGASLPAGTASMRYPTPEYGSGPSCCSMPPSSVAQQPRCRTSIPAGQGTTRGSATRKGIDNTENVDTVHARRAHLPRPQLAPRLRHGAAEGSRHPSAARPRPYRQRDGRQGGARRVLRVFGGSARRRARLLVSQPRSDGYPRCAAKPRGPRGTCEGSCQAPGRWRARCRAASWRAGGRRPGRVRAASSRGRLG
jgi:hypothetical protein